MWRPEYWNVTFVWLHVLLYVRSCCLDCFDAGATKSVLYIRPGTSATLFAAVEKTGKLTEGPFPVLDWNVYSLVSDDKTNSCQASATSP